MPDISPDVLRRFRDDFGFFCEKVGKPRTPYQVEAMRLEARQTVVIAPRQTGKSETLSLRALWAAFRQADQLVMVVSASETAAQRLLATVRQFCQHPILKGSIVDETMTRLVLSNGSRILSMPASEKAIRGWSVDLLIVDEAAFIEDDILLSAALPTTTARPDARVVLSSTPWGDSGAFYSMAQMGFDPVVAHTQSFQWRLLDAPWITQDIIDTAIRTFGGTHSVRYRQEYEGEFVGSGNAYFDRRQILACTADFPMRRDGERMPAKCGLDWGRRQDAHAIAVVGALVDYGVNGLPVVIAAWVETSRRTYPAQVDEVEALAKLWELDIRTETNGVGAYPSEEIARRLAGWTRVVPQSTSLRTKEDFYGRLQVMFSTGGIVIPKHEELLRQLQAIKASPAANGGLKIEAPEGQHDDLPDALALAVGQLPSEIDPSPIYQDVPDCEWAETTGGVRIPLPVRLRHAEPDWSRVYLGEAAKDAIEAPNPWMDVYSTPPPTAEQVIRRLKELGS